jgi:hypothetical protein
MVVFINIEQQAAGVSKERRKQMEVGYEDLGVHPQPVPAVGVTGK